MSRIRLSIIYGNVYGTPWWNDYVDFYLSRIYRTTLVHGRYLRHHRHFCVQPTFGEGVMCNNMWANMNTFDGGVVISTRPLLQSCLLSLHIKLIRTCYFHFINFFVKDYTIPRIACTGGHRIAIRARLTDLTVGIFPSCQYMSRYIMWRHTLGIYRLLWPASKMCIHRINVLICKQT